MLCSIGLLTFSCSKNKGNQPRLTKEKSATEKNQQTNKRYRSWDVILTESELFDFNAKIDPKWSNDNDYLDGSCIIYSNLPSDCYDSESNQQFFSKIGKIQIDLTVFSSIDYAKQNIVLEKNRYTAKYVEKPAEKNTLKNIKGIMEMDPRLNPTPIIQILLI